MYLEKCYITSSVKLKNQLKIYLKKAFDLFLDLPNPTTKPNRDNDSSSSNHHHSNKSTDPNEDNKSDESNNGNECPECGCTFRNPKGLQIHQSSKHNRKQNMLTSAGFWPCHSDKRCDICKQGKFCTSVSSTKKPEKTSNHLLKIAILYQR